MNFQTFLNIIETLFVIFAALGAIYSFFRSKKDETVKIQQNTITALKDSIAAIEKKLDTLAQENTRLKQTIETIQAALKQRGIHVTIDGDMVVIEQATPTHNTSKTSIIRRPRQAASAEPKEEQ